MVVVLVDPDLCRCSLEGANFSIRRDELAGDVVGLWDVPSGWAGRIRTMVKVLKHNSDLMEPSHVTSIQHMVERLRPPPSVKELPTLRAA